MSRPTRICIDTQALLHNVKRVKQEAPQQKIIAMVKANAYGCGVSVVVPTLHDHVSAFGVACLEEAMAIRAFTQKSTCILFQGVFSPDEWKIVAAQGFQAVIHTENQLRWLLTTPLTHAVDIWIKVDTGMHRLGFAIDEIAVVYAALRDCTWVNDIRLVTHLACADEPENEYNTRQSMLFDTIDLDGVRLERSIANSAAILTRPDLHADVVRPGLMLYGVSPFADQTGVELGLKPVMHFSSQVTAIHHYPAYAPIGYGGTWRRATPSIIGIVPVGYGDGYPRHMTYNTPVAVNGEKVVVVGRVSMDMMTIDLTECPGAMVGDEVELWGSLIPVEWVARSAQTIAYECMCHMMNRVSRHVI